jgi:DNA ligase (NAD+)
MDRAINNFDYTEADDIANLLTFAEDQPSDTQSQSAAIKDKIFVITGKLHSFKNRDALKADIETNGGKVAGSVSSKTNYLISNEDSSSAKSIKAKELGITVITEDEYLTMR